jgi:predicted dehydrogenase
MTSNAIRIGILGAGGVAEALHLPILTQMPGVEVAWLCDQYRERAVKLGREWGIRATYDDLRSCPDVDAVLIAIPVGRRHDALSLAFERGWHAFVEKPFATSTEEHLRIVQNAARANVVVGVGLVRRFYRSTSVARRVLSKRTFGSVVEVWAAEAARMGTTGREGSWYQADRAAAGGGVLMETGSHIVDQVFQAIGVESFNGLRAAFTSAGDIDLEARAVANVKLAGADETVPLRLVLSRRQDLYSGVVIRCEHAAIRFGVDAGSAVEVLDAEDRPLCGLQGVEGGTNLHQAFFLEWQAFLEQCRSRANSLVDAASALLSTRFIETAYAHGAGTGRP